MQHPIGAEVSVDHPNYPGVWTVKKNGPVNATLQQEGRLKLLRCPHTLLVDPEVTVTTPGGNVATVTTVPVPEYYVVGEFVRITSGRYAGLWVVIADKGADKVNLAKPGGDNDRYLRVDRRGLVRVPAAEVLRNEYQEI